MIKQQSIKHFPFMRFSFSILLLLKLTCVVSQTNHINIIGKWKIVSLEDKDVYFNFKSDSVVLKSAKIINKKDSMAGIQIARLTMEIIKNTSLYFCSNDTLQIIRNDSIETTEYHLDSLNGMTILSYKSNSNHNYRYYIQQINKIIILKSTKNMDEFIFEKE